MTQQKSLVGRSIPFHPLANMFCLMRALGADEMPPLLTSISENSE
jgi:hypothetical protein